MDLPFEEVAMANLDWGSGVSVSIAEMNNNGCCNTSGVMHL